jgi:hypothetical protein
MLRSRWKPLDLYLLGSFLPLPWQLTWAGWQNGNRIVLGRTGTIEHHSSPPRLPISGLLLQVKGNLSAFGEVGIFFFKERKYKHWISSLSSCLFWVLRLWKNLGQEHQQPLSLMPSSDIWGQVRGTMGSPSSPDPSPWVS